MQRKQPRLKLGRETLRRVGGLVTGGSGFGADPLPNNFFDPNDPEAAGEISESPISRCLLCVTIPGD